MFKRRDKQSSTRVDTLIGKSSSVQGDIEFTGGLHLDGRVTGSVRTAAGAGGTLSISESGVVEGSVEVPSVVLNGVVRGDIVARERVVLGALAKVLGNVSYGAIEMALGAQINGKLIPAAGPAAAGSLEST
jgi:cytoskeletal protein CcmA (bactofilin family)